MRFKYSAASSVVNKLYILDTKWKQPDGMYPVDSDLHQLYVYFKYFGAEKVALLYPSTSSISHSVRKGTFYDGSNTSCDLMLLPVPKWNGSGKLWQLEIANMVKAWL